MHSSATHGGYGHRPAVLEKSKSLTRETPGSSTTVLNQRRQSIIRQPTCFTEDRNLPIRPPSQTILSPNPNPPIRGCERGVTSIAGFSKSENIYPTQNRFLSGRHDYTLLLRNSRNPSRRCNVP